MSAWRRAVMGVHRNGLLTACCSPMMSSSVPGTYGGSYSTQHPLHAAWISTTLYMAAPILPSMTDGERLSLPLLCCPLTCGFISFYELCSEQTP